MNTKINKIIEALRSDPRIPEEEINGFEKRFDELESVSILKDDHPFRLIKSKKNEIITKGFKINEVLSSAIGAIQRRINLKKSKVDFTKYLEVPQAMSMLLDALRENLKEIRDEAGLERK